MPAVLNPAKEVLRLCRINSERVSSSLAAALALQLDDGGYEFCSHLSADVFGVILQTILQTDEHSLDTERGLHLLAVSTLGSVFLSH